ncbi:MAG: trimeric intracellular cation channel family protein [Pseudomonadota bacterium]
MTSGGSGRPGSDKLIFAADLAGVFVFAIEGAIAAMRGHLDLLGILVLAFATALGGGLIRDVLIGAVPPNALRDWRYAALALAAGALTFVLEPRVTAIPESVIICLDAAGLALFAVAGTEKALDYGIPPAIAPLMGAITAIGGGAMRDVLLVQVPAVLRVDFYATAALIGSIVLVGARVFGLSPARAAISGGAICFVLRLVAVWQHWRLPTAIGA